MMMPILFIFTVALLLGSHISECQDQRGFISIPDASRNRLRVLLECGPKTMSVKLFFNTTIFRQFNEWIVVGLNNRFECRQQGNGDLQYLVEIPLDNQPCGTRMIEQAIFENTVSVKKHPLLILEGDDVITVRCSYNLPELQSALVPPFLGPQLGVEPLVPIVMHPIASSVAPVVAAGTMYIIVALILFLLLLFLICCCVCCFMRRRKKRMERRKNVFMSIPQSSELNKLGVGHLWWTGKASCSNDALLSHDYMVSTNSTTRERLSVSTDYPIDTTPTNSSSSPNDAAYPNRKFIQDGVHSIPRARIENNGRGDKSLSVTLRPDNVGRRDSVENKEAHEASYEPPMSLADHRAAAHFKNPSTGKNLRTVRNLGYKSDEILNINAQPVVLYADVKKHPPQYHETRESTADTFSCMLDTGIQSENLDEKSQMTLVAADKLTLISSGGDQRGQANSSTQQKTLVAADVHDATKSTSFGHFNEPTMQNDVAYLQVFIRTLAQNVQQPESDLPKLVRLIDIDDAVREKFVHARTIDDFMEISQMPACKNLYSREKWAILIENMAHVAFLKHLAPSSNVTAGSEAQLISPSGTSDVSRSISISPKSTIDDSSEPEKNPSDRRRLFTRESYHIVKKDLALSNVNNEEQTVSADRSTTEFVEPIQYYMVQQNGSGSVASDQTVVDAFAPPVLNVYLGNVPERSIGVKPAENGNSTNGYYYRDSTDHTEESSSIYGTVNQNGHHTSNANQWHQYHQM